MPNFRWKLRRIWLIPSGVAYRESHNMLQRNKYRLRRYSQYFVSSHYLILNVLNKFVADGILKMILIVFRKKKQKTKKKQKKTNKKKKNRKKTNKQKNKKKTKKTNTTWHFGISCESSTSMKCQALSSLIHKNKYFKMSSAVFMMYCLRVNTVDSQKTHMKCQALYSLKNKNKYFKVSSVVVVISALRLRTVLFCSKRKCVCWMMGPLCSHLW